MNMTWNFFWLDPIEKSLLKSGARAQYKHSCNSTRIQKSFNTSWPVLLFHIELIRSIYQKVDRTLQIGKKMREKNEERNSEDIKKAKERKCGKTDRLKKIEILWAGPSFCSKTCSFSLNMLC